MKRIPKGPPARLLGPYGWDRAGNCVWCGEAGRCQCDHRTADGGPFRLRNAPARPAPWRGEKPEQTRQQVLFSGTDCLPGQQDLFATDREEESEVGSTVLGLMSIRATAEYARKHYPGQLLYISKAVGGTFAYRLDSDRPPHLETVALVGPAGDLRVLPLYRHLP